MHLLTGQRQVITVIQHAPVFYTNLKSAAASLATRGFQMILDDTTQSSTAADTGMPRHNHIDSTGAH